MKVPQRRKGRSVGVLLKFGIMAVLSALLSLYPTMMVISGSQQASNSQQGGAVLTELSSFRQRKNAHGEMEVLNRGQSRENESSARHSDGAENEQRYQVPNSNLSVSSEIIESATPINSTYMGQDGATQSKNMRIWRNHDVNTDKSTAQLRDPLLEPSIRSQKLPLKRDVEYLGVLLDAGRHYFPMEWIYHLIDHLQLLGFNLLHFRLTDDQAFNIRLDSHPELAQPAEGSGGKVYSTEELRQLVDYAHSKNIIIMPEINVPGHAGGWAGAIPRLVVPCARFICSKGYGLPLNVSHPQLMPLLKDVIQEVKDIFSTSPFLHLGGDELEMSRDCFSELDEDMLDYNQFEEDLGQMLLELGIDHDNVVRWEMTGQNRVGEVKTRVKGIDHYWYSRDYQDIATNDTSGFSIPRVFCSHGLYFDSNGEEDAWTIYKNARTMLLHKYKPIGIIAGAFELGVGYWLDRNVMGRLLAVAIGASPENYSEPGLTFYARYQELCTLLDLPDQVCDKAGAPMIPEEEYKTDWTTTTEKWRENLCQRLAIKESHPYLVPWNRRRGIVMREANEIFWNNFLQTSQTGALGAFATNTTVQEGSKSRPSDLNQISTHRIQYTGIILDLVEDGRSSQSKVMRILAILDYMSVLGFNTLQLRIMTDYGFAIKLNSHQKIAFGPRISSYRAYDMGAVKEIIHYASKLGIQVMPELTVAHRAGGWFNAALMTPCPRHHCEEGRGLTLDTSKSVIFPTLSSVLRELRSVFTSPFLHLGFDERNESLSCMKEGGIEPNFDKFESKISKLLEFDEIPLDKVLRWENEEQVMYKKRAGSITHYHKGMPKVTASNDDFFLSTGLHLNDPSSTFVTAWDLYQQVQKLISHKPLGVLASMVTFHDQTLKHLNVRQRLLAIAIGLSNDGLSELAFKQIFLDLCSSAHNKVCRLFGRVRDSEAAATAIREQFEYKKENTCRTRQQNKTEVRPREGVLVENGTDTYKMASQMNANNFY